MGLVANGFRETQTGRIFGSTNVNGANPHTQEYWGHMTARMRNQFAGQGITDSKASVPSGARHPVAWVMARKNGAMASRNEAGLTLTGAASGAMGLPGDGSVTFTIDFDLATGGLISSGTGTADFAVTGTATVLATRSGDGSASFTVNTNTPLLGALGWVVADGDFSITGTLQSYGKGYMYGSTIDGGTLTTTAIAAEVWNSLASAYMSDGTMGEKLNNAASGGVDYDALGQAVWSALLADMTTGGSAGEHLKKLLTTGKFIALKD